MVLGSLTGAMCGGIQSGRFGRKRSLMIDCTTCVSGTLLLAFAPNFHVVLVGRFVTGYASASAQASVPVYTSEISQPQVRKSTGFFTLICYSIGFAVALILGKF